MNAVFKFLPLLFALLLLSVSSRAEENEARVAGNGYWIAEPNLTVVSRLPFDTRYQFYLTGSNDFLHFVELLKGMELVNFGGIELQLEEEGGALLEGKDFGVLGRATKTFPDVASGLYILHGLPKNSLSTITWGGQTEVRRMPSDSTSVIRDLHLLRAEEDQFVRICVSDIRQTDTPQIPLPKHFRVTVVFTVNGKLIGSNSVGKPFRVANWTGGCVDLVGKDIDATLTYVFNPGSKPIDPGVPYKVAGTISVAPLSQIQPQIDLSYNPFPQLPASGGRFFGRWRTEFRRAAIAHKLPFVARYLIDMTTDTADGHKILDVETTSPSRKVHLHEGGGLAIDASSIRLDGAKAIGQYWLVGFDESDFKKVSFTVLGTPAAANSLLPTTVVARFASPKLMRVCAFSEERTSAPLPNEPPLPSRPNMTAVADGKTIFSWNDITGLQRSCLDFFACAFDAGMAKDLSSPGDWRLRGELYYRTHSSGGQKCPK